MIVVDKSGTLGIDRQRGFFPSLLLIAIVSHCVYYFNVLNGIYERCLWLIVLSIVALLIGYFFGMVLKSSKVSLSKKVDVSRNELDTNLLKKISFSLLAVGMIAYLVYYSANPVTTYGESYGAGRGSGFITVFFNFVPISLILNEYIIFCGKTSKRFVLFNRVLIILYCVLHLFYFMKRRQILFLLLTIVAIWGPKLKTSTKTIAYIVGAFLILSFTIYGKVRGFLDANGLAQAIGYVFSNFDIEWLSIDGLEGKYISRTLDDIYGYVQSYGCDPSVLIGVLFCMVPRVLLGGSKPLAFPEWYTFHFYPSDYAAGTGYAGSMVGELYLIGGVFFVLLVYLIIGFVTAKMQKRGKLTGDTVGNVIYAIYIYTLLLLPRYDLASLAIDIVFIYAPIVWAMRHSMTSHSDVKLMNRTLNSKRSMEF